MRRLLWVALGIGALSACCPIPMKRDVTVRPQLHVKVIDGEGKPVEGAAIIARRLVVGPPPTTEVERWTGNTGPRGKVVLAELKDRETYAPLMMHGVNWYGWEVCAEDGGRAGKASYNAQQPVVDPPAVFLDLTLTEPASCAELLELGP